MSQRPMICTDGKVRRLHLNQPRRPSFAIEMQRNINKAPTPTLRQQIVIYPRSDAIKRQAMRLANI